MADTDLKPMSDGDLHPPPANADFEPAEPLKDAGVEFEAEGGTLNTGQPESTRQSIKDGASKYGGQAADRIRTLADTGKEKASGSLDQVSKLLTDAAGQVDEKLGAQYGDYARTAANAVQNFSSGLREKDVDELFDEARDLVRKSPAVAVGIAAALGFVVARLVQSGIDSDKA